MHWAVERDPNIMALDYRLDSEYGVEYDLNIFSRAPAPHVDFR